MRLFALFIVLLPAIAVAADLSKSQRAEIEARIQPFSHACVAGVALQSPRWQWRDRARKSTTARAWLVMLPVPRAPPCWETLELGRLDWIKVWMRSTPAVSMALRVRA